MGVHQPTPPGVLAAVSLEPRRIARPYNCCLLPAWCGGFAPHEYSAVGSAASSVSRHQGGQLCPRFLEHRVADGDRWERLEEVGAQASVQSLYSLRAATEKCLFFKEKESTTR